MSHAYLQNRCATTHYSSETCHTVLVGLLRSASTAMTLLLPSWPDLKRHGLTEMLERTSEPAAAQAHLSFHHHQQACAWMASPEIGTANEGHSACCHSHSGTWQGLFCHRTETCSSSVLSLSYPGFFCAGAQICLIPLMLSWTYA